MRQRQTHNGWLCLRIASAGFGFGAVFTPNKTWPHSSPKPANPAAAYAFFNDMLAIYQALHAVTNSAPGTVGGGGERRRPPPPPDLPSLGASAPIKPMHNGIPSE